MKPVTPGHRARSSERDRDAEIEQEQKVLDQGAMEIDPDELREFLEADLLGVQADPDFKESLRRKLWAMVREKYGSGSGDGSV